MSLVPFEPRKGAVTQHAGSGKGKGKGGTVAHLKRGMQVGGFYPFNEETGPLYTEPPIGTVLKVTAEIIGSEGAAKGRRYDYAIIRANNGRWYTSGSTCPEHGYDWQGLMRFFLTLKNATGVRLC